MRRLVATLYVYTAAQEWFSLRYGKTEVVEIRAFSSSPTWNLTAKSMKARFRKGFPDMGSGTVQLCGTHLPASE